MLWKDHRLASVLRPDVKADHGYTLIESAIAVALFGLVLSMAAGTLVRSIQSNASTSRRIVAVMLAGDALEALRAHVGEVSDSGTPAALLGRGRSMVSPDWTLHADLLADMQPVEDVETVTGTAQPPTAETIWRGRLGYRVFVFVGHCTVTRLSNLCGRPPEPMTRILPYRAVAIVTWPGCERDCRTSVSTWLSLGLDPRFNAIDNDLPVARPDLACTEVGVTTAIPVTANDSGRLGADPLQIELPPRGGLTWDGLLVTWTPPDEWAGQDTFTYYLVDRYGVRSAPTTVVVRAGMGTC